MAVAMAATKSTSKMAFFKLLTNKKIYVTLNTQSSPLWDLSDKAKYEKILKNKSLKSKINRYKAKGLYYLERITDKDKTRELMDILKVQCDFRKEAINNVRPFANNPNKASFYIERQNYPIANHFTVLWSNDKPIAFHFGACVNDTVFIGLSAYDPTESKDSPGTLLLIELGKMLFETGYRYIDLTPGSDQYKECFSNAYQELVEPKFYFSKQEKIKNDTIYQITHIAKKIVSRVGLDIPKIHNLNIINLRNIKKIPFTKVFQKTIRLIYNHHTYLFYRLSTESIKINNNIDSEVNVQKYSDLLLYTESNPWLTRQQLLSEALKRFSMGEILYSIVKEDILVHYGWLSKEKKEYRVAEADMIINVPPDGILLYDFYTEPQFQHQGLYQRNMKQMIFDACKMDAKEIYIGACQNDLFSRQLIEKAGFFLFHTFSKKQVLFHTLSENIVNNF
ncbi:GNAT family N-acetyltransferase [bacterium]|nr:GNAT family N-acetyltransferase [bacterium]